MVASALLYLTGLALLGSCQLSRAWKVANVSRTLFIGNNPYYLPAEPLLSLPSAHLSAQILPFSAFVTNNVSITEDVLANAIASWTAADDVFDESFLQAALIQHNGTGQGNVLSSAISYLNSKDTQLLMLSDISSAPSQSHFSTLTLASVNIPAGPYVLAPDASGSPAIYVPYRLHWDVSQSFFKSVSPLSDGSFAVVSASLDTDSSPYIGIPSKVYALGKDKTQFPLAGVRVSVKDIYFLKGLRTSAGNRDFYSLYPPRNATGPAVSRLIEVGANIVGVTKTVQFANGDRATADWVDYHAPFVPRGDGYREPSGSSTGAGAGVSTHDFIDVGIGSDTGGSIRGPAGANGLYGIRPSVGAISLDDVVPLNDVLDTAGYIARDPHLFSTFGKAWYDGTFASYPSFPKKMLLSDDFQSVGSAANVIYNAFFTKMQAFLGAQISNFSIPAQWNATSGIDVPVTTWLNTTYPTLIAFHQWTVVGEPFFADFAAANGGRNPHINPGVLLRWKYGQSQGPAGYAVALNQRATFENWTLSHFLLEDPESCSDSLYFYPQSAGTYTSREIYYPNAGSPPFGFSSSRIAVHARSPDMVVPIGQVSYNSTISGIVEQLPVTVSIVTRRGCDFMLLDLLKALADEGIVQTVKTGRTAF